MNFFRNFLKSIYVSQFSFYLLICLILASFSITFYLLIILSNELSDYDPIHLLYFLSIDVILVIILIALFIRQIVLVLILDGAI